MIGSAAKRTCAPGSSARSARRPNGSPRITCGCCGRCGSPRNWVSASKREPSPRLKANAAKIKTISAERIREELVKLFRPPHAARGLELLRQSGLLEQVLPEIAATITCEQSPDFHPEGTVFNHLRLMLQHLPACSRPLPALGGSAPRCRQAGHRVRRPEDGQHPLLRPREDRGGHGGGDPASGCGFPANRSRRSSRPCATTCSSRTPCRCASPLCAAC